MKKTPEFCSTTTCKMDVRKWRGCPFNYKETKILREVMNETNETRKNSQSD